MKSIKNTERKRLKRFLKERGLDKAYRRDQKISRRYRDKIVIDGVSVPVVVYKKKGKTIIAHGYNLETISSFKKFNINTIKKAAVKNDVSVGYIGERHFKNFSLVRQKKIEKRKNKVREGRLLLNVTFYKGKKKETVEADNGYTATLISKNERNRARKKAFERCQSQLSFYDPDRHTINWEHYLYANSGSTVRL